VIIISLQAAYFCTNGERIEVVIRGHLTDNTKGRDLKASKDFA